MKYYLATTGNSEVWDLDKGLILLGPWCLTAEDNKRLLKGGGYILSPSPWRPASKIKEAAEYCHRLYEELIPRLSEMLNSLHKVSYHDRYWRFLLGPWLLHFIEILYDRYKRIEDILEAYPDFSTQVIPEEQCGLATFDMDDFLRAHVNEDYYNLKLFSSAARYLCPENTVRSGLPQVRLEKEVSPLKYGLKGKLFYNLIMKGTDIFLKEHIVLTDMYHLGVLDMLSLRYKTGLKSISFRNFVGRARGGLSNTYRADFRKAISFNTEEGGFKPLLLKLLPYALPLSYMENYQFYRNGVKDIKNIDSVKAVGSAVGWYFKEDFKFFAAEAASRNARLVEFQHGGGFGLYLADSAETISLEKDIFYTWGWRSRDSNNARPLPSPHLSKLKDAHVPSLDKVLFVGMSQLRYQYRFINWLLPDDMPKYFQDKKIFLRQIRKEIRDKLLYRPYGSEHGWKEKEFIAKNFPDIEFAVRNRLTEWMKKVKLVIIDHPHTSILEALVINVPCVFYWDHEVYLMRPEAENYFEDLRNLGILHRSPESAAEKINEIYENPAQWWLNDKLQAGRKKFCDSYAFARKDWLNLCAKEFKQALL